jgi:hypothetical protein
MTEFSVLKSQEHPDLDNSAKIEEKTILTTDYIKF